MVANGYPQSIRFCKVRGRRCDVDKKWRTAENSSENLGEGQTRSIEQLISRCNEERKIRKVRFAGL